MSLLQQLQKKRTLLKSTTTVVTTLTGERYIEDKNTSAQKKLTQRSYGFVVDTKPDAVPACIITDFLYLGSQDAVTAENVKNYKLTHILSVGIETPPYFEVDNIECKFISCLDLPETNLFPNVVFPAIDFIKTAKCRNGRVLVHCNAGVSRSASVVIAYLMLQSDMCFQDAFDLIKLKRQCVQPNAGFIHQLKTYK